MAKLAAPPKNNTRTFLPTIHIHHPPQAIDPASIPLASYRMSTTMDGVRSLKPLNGFVINNLTCFHVSLEQGRWVRKLELIGNKQKEGLEVIDIGL